MQPSPKSSPVWANSPAAFGGPGLPGNLSAGAPPLGRMETEQPGIATTWDATQGIRYAESPRLAVACLPNANCCRNGPVPIWRRCAECHAADRKALIAPGIMWTPSNLHWHLDGKTREYTRWAKSTCLPPGSRLCRQMQESAVGRMPNGSPRLPRGLQPLARGPALQRTWGDEASSLGPGNLGMPQLQHHPPLGAGQWSLPARQPQQQLHTHLRGPYAGLRDYAALAGGALPCDGLTQVVGPSVAMTPGHIFLVAEAG